MASILEVNNLSFSVNTKNLYNDVSFSVNKEDHLGIVGANGTGKSTLINLIINKLEADTGEIKWQKKIKIGYLDQHAEIETNMTIFDFLKLSFTHLFDVEKELNDLYERMAVDFNDEMSDRVEELQNKLTYSGFYDLDATINKVAAGLGVTKLGMDTLLKNISGGQRAKVILSKLLLESPDVLLMDEPTNFLDKEHVDWLTKYLQNFPGAFIIISHDFDFLDAVTNTILNIENKTVKKYTGSFQQFLKLKEENAKNLQTQFDKQQKQIKGMKDFIARFGAGTRASMAQSRQKALDKMDIIEPPANINVRPVFDFKSLPIANGKILDVENLEIGYSKKLLPPLNFRLYGQQKIVINGFNGIGKSTLIKTLTGLIPPLGGEFHWENNVKIGYFEQELVWTNPNGTAFDAVKEKFPKVEDGVIWKWVAASGVKGRSATQPLHTLSGGEQVKIKMCILVHTPCNVLILDEPTNHIDAASKEVLEEELKKWEGSLILITHEHSFYQGWITDIIQINKK